MLAPTHIVTATVATSLPLLFIDGLLQELTILFYIGVIVGSIFPDVDEPDSVMGKKLSFISYPINILFGHRTITHSFLFGALIIYVGIYFDIKFVVGLGVGIVIHILSDSVTVAGIKGALFPLASLNKKFVILPYFLRFTVGSITELIILTLLGLLQIYILLIV